MKKIVLLNQDEEPICEIEYGKFNTGILELKSGYYVVNVVPHEDGRSYQVALYRDVQEAAQAVQELKDFAFAVTKPNQEGFAMPQASAPVSALEILGLLV